MQSHRKARRGKTRHRDVAMHYYLAKIAVEAPRIVLQRMRHLQRKKGMADDGVPAVRARAGFL